MLLLTLSFYAGNWFYCAFIELYVYSFIVQVQGRISPSVERRSHVTTNRGATYTTSWHLTELREGKSSSLRMLPHMYWLLPGETHTFRNIWTAQIRLDGWKERRDSKSSWYGRKRWVWEKVNMVKRCSKFSTK